MQITRIEATNALSYSSLDLPLSRGLTVVTGPNGAGKTSLGRVIDLTCRAVKGCVDLDWTSLTHDYGDAGHFGALQFTVRLGLQFDKPNELELLELWARTSLLTAVMGVNAESAETFDRILPDAVGSADILANGCVEVSYDARRRQPWVTSWLARVGTRDAILSLESNILSCSVDGVGAAPAQGLSECLRSREDPLVASPLSDRWRSSLQIADLLEFGPVELIARPTGREPEPRSARILLERMGLTLDSHRSIIGFGRVLDHLLSHGVLLTSNRRVQTVTEVPVGDLVKLVPLGDGSRTALELLRRKTGSPTDRESFQAARDVFQRLTGQALDVVQGTVQVGPDSHDLRATPVVITAAPDGTFVDIPLGLAGAGVEEAAVLAILLTDPSSILVLDEPATNLSPVAQHRMVAELGRLPERQIILITHSAHLVQLHSAADLARVVRLTRDINAATVVHRPSADPLLFDKLRRLYRSADLRATLFAAAVLLVEGPTEEEALAIWLSDVDSHNLGTPEELHVLLIAVSGQQEFPNFAKLLAELGVPYGILADGPAFRPGKVLDQLPQKPADIVGPHDFDQQRNRWAASGAWSLATDFHDDGNRGGEIEAFFDRIDSTTWKRIRADGKIRKGRVFATEVPVPKAVVQVWCDFLKHVDLPVNITSSDA